MIEAIHKLGKMTKRMLFTNGMEGASQRVLHVAKHRVTSLEDGMLRRLASAADDNRLMKTAGICHVLKTTQTVGDDPTANYQAAFGVLVDRRFLETLYAT